jgi:hypothetical protein
MEHFSVNKTDSGYYIEGFPEALKVFTIEGAQSKRLADLALHKTDLDFAGECLETINQVSNKPSVLRKALWQAAIISYIKCFGNSQARSQLSAENIYQGNKPALIAFNYFKNLRNKHFVHDENSYAQSIPGAILNRREKLCKIEKIVCLSVKAETLSQVNYQNLHLLIQTTRVFVVSKFDMLCETLTKELEAHSYDNLLNRKAIIYRAPTICEIEFKRNTP